MPPLRHCTSYCSFLYGVKSIDPPSERMTAMQPGNIFKAPLANLIARPYTLVKKLPQNAVLLYYLNPVMQIIFLADNT